MALSYVVLTGTFVDSQDNPLSGSVSFVPNVTTYASNIPVLTAGVPITAAITAGQLLSESGGPFQLLATDNAGLSFEGLTGFLIYTATVTVSGVTQDPWSFALPSSPSPVELFELANTGSGGGGGGSGTVTSVSVATANGLAGTVANPTSTPAITLRTSVTGLLKGNGTAISAGVAGTDYLAPNGSGAALTGITAAQVGADAAGSAAAVAAEVGQANGIASLDSGTHVPVAQLPAATSGAEGIVQLAGDLGGTASSPQVTGTHLASPLPVNQGGTGSATQNFADLTTSQNIGGVKTFTGEIVVPVPVNPNDAVTKSYADAIATGLSVKASVQEATAAALPANTYANGASGVGATLTANANGALTVDGIAVTGGDRVLVQNEATASRNGIYTVTVAGSAGTAYVLTRATDMNTGAQVPGAFCFCEQGTANAGAGFTVASPGPFTIGTTAINWTQFSGAGEVTAGTGLSKSGNTISLTSPVTIALGGTGQATQQAALDALAGAVTSGSYLRGNGTHVVLGAIQAGDVPTLNQSTSGNAGTATNLAGAATFPARVTGHVVTLTDGSSVAVDASLGNLFDWPLGAGSHTLAVPSNAVNGDSIVIRIAYSGSFTPLFASGAGGYSFGTDGQPSWTATNATVDLVGFEFNSGLGKWLCTGWKLGFS